MADTRSITTITVCSRADETIQGIVVCDEEEDASIADIRVCAEDDGDIGPTQGECANLDPLLISGPADVQAEDVYTASGGLAPYQFIFEGGSIATSGNQGIVVYVAPCNTGTWGVGSSSAGMFNGFYALSWNGNRVDWTSGVNYSSIWIASITQSVSFTVRRVSDDEVISTTTYSETAGEYYRLKHDPNLVIVEKSTDYSCAGEVTVIDACGNTASLPVDITP